MPTSLYIASDHAGFERKQRLVRWLASQGYDVIDLGPSSFDPEDDYPDYALPLAKRVVDQDASGILVCGNGQGVCIAANKVRGVRAVSASSPQMAETTRADDNANILCLPGRFMKDEEIEEIVQTWLTTPFSGADRHARRLRKLAEYEAS